jgi:uncharacterized protein YidB (DUF937 family)
MGGIDDLLGGLMGGKGGGAIAALAPMLGGLLAGGGLEKLLSGFQRHGLSDKTDSWIGTGPNEPVTGDEVREVLGSAQLADIAQKLGITEQQAAQALAESLPRVIDGVSPEGQLPPEDRLDSLFESIRQPAATT